MLGVQDTRQNLPAKSPGRLFVASSSPFRAREVPPQLGSNCSTVYALGERILYLLCFVLLSTCSAAITGYRPYHRMGHLNP